MVHAKVRKAVIPAAGLGTRFLPLTKAQPKEMLPVVDKPVIQYVVEEAVHSGIDDILIITGRSKRAIEDHFDASFELEYRLNRMEMSGSARRRKTSPKWLTCITSGKKSKGALEMPFSMPRSTATESRLRSYWAILLPSPIREREAALAR